MVQASLLLLSAPTCALSIGLSELLQPPRLVLPISCHRLPASLTLSLCAGGVDPGGLLPLRRRRPQPGVAHLGGPLLPPLVRLLLALSFRGHYDAFTIFLNSYIFSFCGMRKLSGSLFESASLLPLYVSRRRPSHTVNNLNITKQKEFNPAKYFLIANVWKVSRPLPKAAARFATASSAWGRPRRCRAGSC